MAKEIITAQPKQKKSKLGDIIVLCIVLLLVGSAIYLFAFGFKDYTDMKDMQLTWSEVSKVADTEDKDAPTQYIEYRTDDNKNIIIPELSKQVPSIEDTNTVNIAELNTVDYLYRPINLEALRSVNVDVSGYIYIPDTYVDYPILKETTSNTYYYLTHNINKYVDKYGSIFELSDEERNVKEMSNAVNIIFGHHMKSGAMFTNLFKYTDSSFNTNPIYIYRDDYRIEYAVFAACTMNSQDSLYDFDAYELGSENYEKLLTRLAECNQITCDAAFPDNSTPIIVLSTCKDAYSDVRFIVCAIEIRRAMVPEYYNSLEQVKEYGGDENAIAVETEMDTSMFNKNTDVLDNTIGNDINNSNILNNINNINNNIDNNIDNNTENTGTGQRKGVIISGTKRN